MINVVKRLMPPVLCCCQPWQAAPITPDAARLRLLLLVLLHKFAFPACLLLLLKVLLLCCYCLQSLCYGMWAVSHHIGTCGRTME